MSDPVIIIGGGPRPTANIYAVSMVSNDPSKIEPVAEYQIRDGDEVLLRVAKLSHAQALLPLIRSGD